MSDFEDNFEVFNQSQSPEAFTGDFNHLPPIEVSQTQGDLPILEAMGIHCKPRAGLFGIMESQSGSKAPEKTTPAKLLHPSYLPDLILRTTRERGIKEVMK